MHESIHLKKTNYYYFGRCLTLHPHHHHRHHNIIKSTHGIIAWSKNARIKFEFPLIIFIRSQDVFLCVFFFKLSPTMEFTLCIFGCYSFVYIVHYTRLLLASDILMCSIVCFMMPYNCILAERVEHFPLLHCWKWTF